jgi:hypothetical protein
MRLRFAHAALFFALLVAAPRAWGEGDPMAVYRQQFKEGLDAYQAGRFADAILKWQPIYEELGPKTAYRLSFNLGRAYEEYGDLTRAAERYESYLAEVDARRNNGEALEAVVLQQETEARDALSKLVSKQARIRIKPGAKPTMVQIDATEPRLAGFTAYVRPGPHVVTFGPGTPAAAVRNVTAQEGTLVDLEPPSPPADEARIVVVQPKTQTETVHPIPAWVVWTGAGVTVLSALIPAGAYLRALDTRDRYNAATDPTTKAREASNYDSQRNGAYVSWVFPIAFGAVTAGLATWYILGTTKREVPIAIGPGWLGAHGSF